MPSTATERYAALVSEGEIERDPAQEAVAARLTRLEQRLAQHRLSRKSSHLGWLFGKNAKQEGPIKGLYVYGDVGRGKTMLMDLFFAASEVKRKRRVHFHEFMADVHERVHIYRQHIKSGEIGDGDPIAHTAAALAEEAWLLCFDEFHVTDIADAMILGRLFTRLFEAGVVVVATSNVEPDELYKDGLNRALFTPFIALLHQHMDVVRLEAPKDFRLEKLSSQPVWYVPADEDAEVALDNAWQRLTGLLSGEPCEIAAKGRMIRVPEAERGVARFSFRQLCGQPLGASDYLRIAHEFHTLIIEGIPVMDYPQRNEAKRFIALIDTLYDNGVKLVASAEAEPQELYLAAEGYEANEFKRTASRLIEMRSAEYLALPHGRRVEAASGSSAGIVET
ncbi:MAG: AFG1 family ATPase [Alphaproteobacteria bacterium]|nr:MAG: AFG1 family ATPase [Alphaproteobacteria bacterium]